jgi:RNA polymerase sigma factor (TIGR02999 family)
MSTPPRSSPTPAPRTPARPAEPPAADPAADLLLQATRGDGAEVARLLPDFYGDLRRVAAGYLERERTGHTLQPTALVHEAYLRLARANRTWNDSVHVLAAAALAMRRVLVDHARQRHAEKRNAPGTRVPLATDGAAAPGRELELIELDDLLERLRQLDARKARVVELRFFAAMTNEQVAEVLGVARSTVAEDWAIARAWLASQLREQG